MKPSTVYNIINWGSCVAVVLGQVFNAYGRTDVMYWIAVVQFLFVVGLCTGYSLAMWQNLVWSDERDKRRDEMNRRLGLS